MTDPAEVATKLRTVVGIPVVAYASDGSLDLTTTASLAQRLVDSGLRAITPNGNTGEFYALSPSERDDVLRTVSEVCSDRAIVIAGVGLDLQTAIAEAQAAAGYGAHAVMVHQPVVPYLSRAGWVDYVATVAGAVPELAVLPYVSSAIISGSDITELARRAPNVVGMKYSVPDPVAFGQTVRSTEADILWIAGLAESYAPSAWLSGARAFTSGLVNVTPQIALALFNALNTGDHASAHRLWSSIRDFEEMRSRDHSAANVSVVKEAMHQLGLCDRSVRPPSSVLSAEERSQVARILEEWEVAP